MVRKMLIIMLVAAFSVSMPGLGISAGMGKEGKGHGDAMGKDSYQGTVTKVEGDTVTLKGADCEERTVMATGEGTAPDIQVGDHVWVKDGRLSKADATTPKTGEANAPYPGENC